MQKLLENLFLKSLVADLPRDSSQLNAFLESDAELVRIDDSLILAITADSIVEEIASGLYTDPYLIGWMTVMASLSDLAAVGARPIGLVLLQHLPKDLSASDRIDLQKGIKEACLEADVKILGGDTNASTELQMGAAALGLIDDNKTIMRSGSEAGDILFTSAALGAGNAFAFSRFFGSEPFDFQPKARLKEGHLIRQYGSSCIDTSDGFFPAISNLVEINQRGFAFDDTLDFLVAGPLREMAAAAHIPAWFFLAGPHGEFELLFTVPPKNLEKFEQAAKAIGWEPLALGRVIASPTLLFDVEEEKKQIDPFPIANLFEECGGKPDLYLDRLLKIKLYG